MVDSSSYSSLVVAVSVLEGHCEIVLDVTSWTAAGPCDILEVYSVAELVRAVGESSGSLAYSSMATSCVICTAGL